MAAGVGLTALVAWLTYRLTGPALLQSPLMWIFFLAPLALVFFISSRINTMPATTARVLFFVYAALVGVSLSILLHIYTQSSITRVFFVAATMFGALSVFGYTTRRDLSGLGIFLFMGLIGVILASVVNLLLRSSELDWLISIVGIGVFAGLTAYDTQRIKTMYDGSDDELSAGPKGGYRRVVALPQLHQPIHDAATACRRSALGVSSRSGRFSAGEWVSIRRENNRGHTLTMAARQYRSAQDPIKPRFTRPVLDGLGIPHWTNGGSY